MNTDVPWLKILRFVVGYVCRFRGNVPEIPGIVPKIPGTVLAMSRTIQPELVHVF